MYQLNKLDLVDLALIKYCPKLHRSWFKNNPYPLQIMIKYRSKINKIIPFSKMTNLINNMLLKRLLKVFINGDSSNWNKMKNGLPQGWILAILWFRISINQRLSPSLSMAEACCFYLNSEMASYKLNVMFNGVLIDHKPDLN